MIQALSVTNSVVLQRSWGFFGGEISRRGIKILYTFEIQLDPRIFQLEMIIKPIGTYQLIELSFGTIKWTLRSLSVSIDKAPVE